MRKLRIGSVILRLFRHRFLWVLYLQNHGYL